MHASLNILSTILKCAKVVQDITGRKEMFPVITGSPRNVCTHNTNDIMQNVYWYLQLQLFFVSYSGN